MVCRYLPELANTWVKIPIHGESVFDWAWAEAYRRNGFDYYPKLVTAIPFSPVAGPRMGLSQGVDSGECIEALLLGFSTWWPCIGSYSAIQDSPV